MSPEEFSGSNPSASLPNPQDLIQGQIEYYRARANEYDEWVYRKGRYDHGPKANQEWVAEQAEVSAALAAFGPRGKVLELAGGTGYWTEQLLQHADSVTVVDASPEMLALNRERVGSERVTHRLGDIFAFQSDDLYDVVFFGFWLSHVPPERFAEFWHLVRRSLKPDGRFFFVDSLYNPESTAKDHRLEGPDRTTTLRRLNDGREFTIVKVFYRPADLAARLAVLGWQTEARATANHFVYVAGKNIESLREVSHSKSQNQEEEAPSP